ncbi:hypothetical protein GALMADRAFT_885476 [Galerina marginata CBS 339.88]|uniref:Uncharacterized protein n=1 Tax=Galerina marginata (strain CBS 339.88) TaxID=685588 RepID=A0A067SHR5_GALM3|nr:hypothetical protein GALMADRAFT_885476 [Galerina marginata CBS 339.88]
MIFSVIVGLGGSDIEVNGFCLFFLHCPVWRFISQFSLRHRRHVVIFNRRLKYLDSVDGCCDLSSIGSYGVNSLENSTDHPASRTRLRYSKTTSILAMLDLEVKEPSSNHIYANGPYPALEFSNSYK